MQNFGGGKGANSSEGREEEEILYTNMNVSGGQHAHRVCDVTYYSITINH